jgi:hypothetical protein
MDEQPGTPDETGDAPRPGSWQPPPRDPWLSGFARGGDWDRCPPGADLAFALEEASGKDWRCPDARHGELIGLLRQWQALESWAAAGKLGLLRTLIEEDAFLLPGDDPRGTGKLPGPWSKALSHEVALALAMPAVSADRLMWDGWDLGTRLPEIGRRLAEGKLTLAKARAVNDALAPLSEEDVILAEELITDRLAQEPSMTYGQLEKAAATVAVLVDPDSAARRRKGAEQDSARVAMFREASGAAGLSGRDLPVDETLTANARLLDRAQEYKDSGAFPGARMDWLQAVAFLDLLNDITASQRIAFAQAAARPQPGDPYPGQEAPGPDDWNPDDEDPDDPGADDGGPHERGPDSGDDTSPGGGTGPFGPPVGGPGCPCRECDGTCNPSGDDESDPGPDGNCCPDEVPPGGGETDPDPEDGRCPNDDVPPADDDSDPDPGAWCPDDVPAADDDTGGSAADGDQAGTGPASDGPASDGPGPAGPPMDGAAAAPASEDPALPPRLTDLVIPLPTLLGWDERPGESHGLGPLDPDLCRTLATLAAASQHTCLCITVTTDDGTAIGHGCARRNPPRQKPGCAGRTGTTGPPGTLPARLNLTVTDGLIAGLTATTPVPGAPPPGPGWRLARDPDPGPPGGYGTWTLTLPGGRRITVALEPVPTFDCDHRHESHAYQPNDTLRHLVQVRDRTCTLPVCSRPARECDFEHATPYDQGGRTCSCNAGARSRACHQVKQAEGWKVTQPLPGWHVWETPSGRLYTQAPYRYPV